MLLNDEEGLRLFIDIFNCLDSKEKKILIKSMKNDTNEA